MRDPKYRRWLKRQHCVVCKKMAETDATKVDFYGCIPVDPAHTENNGASSKGPDSSCVPLGRKHHREYDFNRKEFEDKYRVDMKVLAAQYYAQYLKENGTKAGLPVPESESTIDL